MNPLCPGYEFEKLFDRCLAVIEKHLRREEMWKCYLMKSWLSILQRKKRNEH